MTKQLDMFHNTIGLLPSEVAPREVKNSKQSDIILKLFEDNMYQSFTPCEVHLLTGQQYPITSIRRAITDLTKMNKLEKTDLRRKGMYGELNYTWKLRESAANQKYFDSTITQTK